MTLLLRHIRFCITFIAIMLMAVSCRDELLFEEVPEGETRVMATVHFTPLVEAELDQKSAPSRSDGMVFGGEEGVVNGDNTVAPTGNAMDQIQSLVILFYDTQGNLSETISPVTVDLLVYPPMLEERTDADASNGVSAQEKTYGVNFPLDVPYGDYKIFAVANVKNLLSDHAEDIKTIEGLRSIRLAWVSNSIARNTEMFGTFSTSDGNTGGTNFEADNIVSVRPGVTKLHSWMRRAVSKITIDFDGSNLRDNVYVYIKEARVYDIADGCYLGHYSCVGDAPADSGVSGGFGFGNSAHRLVYGKGKDYESWPVVVKGSKLDSYTKDGVKYGYHDELAYCLPFYENMQGEGRLKYQDSNHDGAVDFPNAGEYETNADGTRKWLHDEAKDAVPNGTYVEVVGYYRSQNENYVSEGPIRYRFMIGKNVDTNYDCERNHHYKLTLSFRGNGNDADWHIEYKEEKGVYLPRPLYISYLYNHEMKLPVRVNTGGQKVSHLKIKIISNNWAPNVTDYNANPYDYYRALDEKKHFGNDAPYNGFLTLIKSSATTVSGPGGDADFTYNEKYFNEAITDPDGYSISRGERLYSVVPGKHGNEEQGEYTVKRGRNVIEAVIPLYTNAKQMVSRTGYTGNNPYENYERRALVEVTAVLADGTTLPAAQTEIFQVRRVTNPKGIFRRHDNSKPFDVVLTELLSEKATEFTPLKSHGSWRAYVIAGDNGFLTLDGKSEVGGQTNSTVKFQVRFNGTINADQSRFAVIRVEYHNYNCVHLIFVRQGDSPVSMYSGSPLWHCYNMRTATEEVENPIDEGSLFRFGNWSQPIDACSNRYTHKEYWTYVTPEDFKAPGKLKIAGKTKENGVDWTSITSKASTGSFSGTTVNGSAVSVATMNDFINLRDNTEQGYGILYGNSATTVQIDRNKAYGYHRDENGNSDLKCGMRGCFSYIGYKQGNELHPRAEHVFFPIGSSGFGHRKEGGVHGFGEAEIGRGVLRYAAGRTGRYYFDNGPLFYNIYKSEGAVYWAERKTSAGMALDINYFSFDFNTLPPGNLYGYKNTGANYSDACFVRCVTR